MTVRILTGDCRALLATLDAESVQTCVTSPPYFGLRDYGVAGQIGLEATPDAFVAEMVGVFREVRRVLKADGTLWLNLGDSYAGSCKGAGDTKTFNRRNTSSRRRDDAEIPRSDWAYVGMKAKDLIGIPWRVAFALQADGWYLRSDIIWHKPNPMPESVTDRPTKSHEYLFLLSKSERYYYDAAAIREPLTESSLSRLAQNVDAQEGSHRVPGKTNGTMKAVRRSGNKERKPASARGVPVDTRGSSNGAVAGSVPWEDNGTGRNARTVWTIATQPFKGAHFATFPPELVEPCILAGSKRGDLVLDPFGGAGTTGLVADRLGRDAVLCELNPAYARMALHRITDDAPLLAETGS